MLEALPHESGIGTTIPISRRNFLSAFGASAAVSFLLSSRTEADDSEVAHKGYEYFEANSNWLDNIKHSLNDKKGFPPQMRQYLGQAIQKEIGSIHDPLEKKRAGIIYDLDAMRTSIKLHDTIKAFEKDLKGTSDIPLTMWVQDVKNAPQMRKWAIKRETNNALERIEGDIPEIALINATPNKKIDPKLLQMIIESFERLEKNLKPNVASVHKKLSDFSSPYEISEKEIDGALKDKIADKKEFYLSLLELLKKSETAK